MNSTSYDISLNDDAAHADVRAARAAGRAWAEREWDACNQEEQAEQSWIGTQRDALSLVDVTIVEADDANYDELRLALADEANQTASATWESLTAAFRACA